MIWSLVFGILNIFITSDRTVFAISQRSWVPNFYKHFSVHKQTFSTCYKKNIIENFNWWICRIGYQVVDIPLFVVVASCFPLLPYPLLPSLCFVCNSSPSQQLKISSVAKEINTHALWFCLFSYDCNAMNRCESICRQLFIILYFYCFQYY